MAAKEIFSRAAPLLLGRCVPCQKSNASKFKVKRLVLDSFLNMVCTIKLFTVLVQVVCYCTQCINNAATNS